MKLIEWTAVLGNVGELVGAVAVFATLFYLARQSSHSSAAQDRANQLAQSESVNSSNALFIDAWRSLPGIVTWPRSTTEHSVVKSSTKSMPFAT